VCSNALGRFGFKLRQPATKHFIDGINIEVRNREVLKAWSLTDRISRSSGREATLGILNLGIDIAVSFEGTKRIHPIWPTGIGWNRLCKIAKRRVVFFNALHMALQRRIQCNALRTKNKFMQPLPMGRLDFYSRAYIRRNKGIVENRDV